MRFLANMNVPRVLCARLREHGHECRHVADLGMAQSADSDILLAASQTGEVVLTHDLDYGELLALSGDAGPSVVIFRLRRVLVDDLLGKLLVAWPRIEAALENGAVVIIGDRSVRVRDLPIEPAKR